MQPIPTFKKYVEGKWWKKELKDFVLKNCAPKKVARVDALAAEFNADIDRMKREKDTQKLRDFARRAVDIQKSIFEEEK